MEKEMKCSDTQKRALAKLIEDRTTEVHEDTCGYGYGRAYRETEANRKSFLQEALNKVSKIVSFDGLLKRKTEADKLENVLQEKVDDKRAHYQGLKDRAERAYQKTLSKIEDEQSKFKATTLNPATSKLEALEKELIQHGLRFYDSDALKLTSQGETDLIIEHNAKVEELRMNSLSQLWLASTLEEAKKIVEKFVNDIR